MSCLRHRRIPVVPHDAAADDTKLCVKQCVFSANRTLCASAVETELAIAMRRVMQAEAHVLQQWNDVKAIVAKPPKDRHDGELENAKEALEFAKAANARAEAALTEAKLDKAQATMTRFAASNGRPLPDAKSQVCFADSMHPSFYLFRYMYLAASLFISLSLC